MRIALIHGNDGSDVRVGKTCRSLARLGFDTHFIGWDRRPGAEKEIDLGGATAHVTCQDTLRGQATATGYSAFLRHAVRALYRLRPDVVCAVNEELAFALLPYRGWLYGRLVCEIYDSLDARAQRRPWPLRQALGIASALALRGSDRLIATDETRRAMLGRFAAKAIVVENVPEDPGVDLARLLPEGPVRIWAAGSLVQERGLRQLLEAIEPLDGVRVVSAGWPYDAYSSETFLRHPRVEFHGIVTARRALELAAGCDAVYSYYAPTNQYMVNASPNKVYDAMAIGRPVVINREVRLSAWVEQERVGYVCSYQDVDSLRSIIAGLADRRIGLPEFAIRTRGLFLERYQWAQMEARLATMYRGISVAAASA